MECEMCGRKIDKSHKVRIDNAILNVCDACSKFGVPVDSARSYNALASSQNKQFAVRMPEKRPARVQPYKTQKKPRKKPVDYESMDIVDDYAELIKDARERLSWTQEDLAKKILERKNVLSNIERGELMPDIKIAKKLERLLGIKLITTE
jgi:putative transcription factor